MLRLLQIILLGIGTFIIVGFVPLLTIRLGFPGEILSGFLLLLIACFIASRRDQLTLILDKSAETFRFKSKNYWKEKLLVEGKIDTNSLIHLRVTTERFHSGGAGARTAWHTLVIDNPGDSDFETIAFNSEDKAETERSRLEHYLASDSTDLFQISGKEPILGIVVYGALSLLFFYLGISKLGCEKVGGRYFC